MNLKRRWSGERRDFLNEKVENLGILRQNVNGKNITGAYENLINTLLLIHKYSQITGAELRSDGLVERVYLKTGVLLSVFMKILFPCI